jgi:electron transfer flavoprotein beta subunit
MAYNMIVFVNQTPDMNAVRVDRSSGKALLGDQLVMGAADAIAVEAALQLKEAHGGDVTVVAAGPASVKDVLQRALAMGADRGVHVELAGPNEIDSLAMARVLADAVKDRAADILITGQAADDYGSSQVPAQVAELLGLAQVSWVTKLAADGATLTMERDTEDGKQGVVANTPLLIMASDGLNEPRYPSLKGIMAAKKKEIATVPATVVASDTVSWSEPVAQEKTASGILVQDKPAAEAVAELVAWLKANKLV